MSRGGKIVENAFGITVQRFLVLLSTIQQEPLVLATIAITLCTIQQNEAKI